MSRISILSKEALRVPAVPVSLQNSLSAPYPFTLSKKAMTVAFRCAIDRAVEIRISDGKRWASG